MRPRVSARLAGSALGALALVVLASPAQAQGTLEVDSGIAAAITAASLVGTIAVTLALPVTARDDHQAQAETERFGFDQVVRGRWSTAAHEVSNATLLGALTLPLVAHGAVEAPALEDALWLYGETLSTTLLLNTVAKRVVQRPRPYTYGEEGEARSASAGSDAWVSFYSGHSAMSFAAATSGALAMTLRTDDLQPRLWVWGLGMAAASATATLRVRAGRHYPSDIVVGMLAGVGMGALFPLLHAGGDVPLRAEEVGVAVGGLGVGLAFALLWPLPSMPPLAVGPADPAGGVRATLTMAL